MKQEAAEALALEAMAFIIGDERLGPMFLGHTGLAPAELAAAAGDPATLTGVLEFLMQDDRWLTDFCSVAGWRPEDIQRALAALPGGQAPHWT